MGYSKSFKAVIAASVLPLAHSDVRKSYNFILDSASCCGIKELSQLERLKAICEQLKLDFKTQLALLIRERNREGYTLHYFNVDSEDQTEMGPRTIEVLKVLKDFGFTEFTRFINANHKYRADYLKPLYTVGLALIPDFDRMEWMDDLEDEENQ